MKIVFNIKICTGFFVHSLPSTPAFNSIPSELPDQVATFAHEHDYGLFITLTEHVLELNTIFPFTPPCQGRVASVPTSTSGLPLIPAAVSDPPPKPAQPVQSCNNCKLHGLHGVGHTDGTCFQPGGGMEVCQEEYLRNKGHMHAMFAECLDNALEMQDSFTKTIDYSPPTSPHILPTLDGEVLIPPVANFCVLHFTPNTDLPFDLYL